MRALVLALAVPLAACGYRPLYAGSTERLGVVVVSSKVPDAAASDEVAAGVRDELARAGALSPGTGYPRCEIEVLRADEASEGVAAGDVDPESRATRVGVVARAWVVRSKDGARERDTGDVRAFETVAVAPDARAATFRHADALRAAGRRAGRVIGARILGLPAADE